MKNKETGDTLSYLNYLDSEINKANEFGQKCQRVNKDFNSAQTWYSVAEAFKMAKEKAIKLLVN